MSTGRRRSWSSWRCFFFKQKTAYEIVSRDWSSDVCSSDLLVQSGSKGVLWHGIAHKVVIPALAAPAIAFGAAFLLLLLIYWVFVWLSPGVANRGFRLGQLATGTWVAFTHGANDAQKTMGVIALALVLHRHGDVASLEIPTWVKVAA